MKITRDIQSVTDFKQNTAKFIKQVQETKEPLILTVNGKAAVVIQDAGSFENLVDSTERSKEIVLVQQRLDRLQNTRERIAAEEVFKKVATHVGVDLA